jgi:hypothetical protein
MAEEDQRQDSFQLRAAEIATDAAAAVSAALAALASGAALRANEIISLAEQTGSVTLPIRSTCIASLEYTPESGDLVVTFTDGSQYPYHQVSMINLLRWYNDVSQGSFYNREVRGQWT